MPREGDAVTETVVPGAISEAFSTVPWSGITSKSASARSERVNPLLISYV
jgi:hypothetical protein